MIKGRKNFALWASTYGYRLYFRRARRLTLGSAANFLQPPTKKGGGLFNFFSIQTFETLRLKEGAFLLAFLSLLASSRGDVVGVQSESLNVGKALQSRTFNSLKRAIHFLKLVRSYTTSGTLVAQPSSKATASKYTIPPFGGEKVIRSLGSAFSRELNLVCPFFYY